MDSTSQDTLSLAFPLMPSLSSNEDTISLQIQVKEMSALYKDIIKGYQLQLQQQQKLHALKMKETQDAYFHQINSIILEKNQKIVHYIECLDKVDKKLVHLQQENEDLAAWREEWNLATEASTAINIILR